MSEYTDRTCGIGLPEDNQPIEEIKVIDLTIGVFFDGIRNNTYKFIEILSGVYDTYIMKIFMLLVVITFTISCQCTVSEIKLSVIQCECEQTSMDNSENPDERDTITYVGVFGSIKDSVLIYNTTMDKIKVYLRKYSKGNFSLCFYDNDVIFDTLKIYCSDNLIYINDDIYHLYPESYCRFKDNVNILSLADMLSDCLGDYPKEMIALLNLNWGIHFEKYHIDTTLNLVQSPHSDLKYEYRTKYYYDDQMNLYEVIQKDRYVKKRVSKTSDSISLYHIEYNYGDRESGEFTESRNAFGIENIKGTSMQISSAHQLDYKKSYSQPIIYNVANDILSEKIVAIYDEHVDFSTRY